MKTRNLTLNISLCDDMLSGKIHSQVRSKDLSFHALDYVQFTPVKNNSDGTVTPTIHPIASAVFQIVRIQMGRELMCDAAIFTYSLVKKGQERV